MSGEVWLSLVCVTIATLGVIGWQGKHWIAAWGKAQARLSKAEARYLRAEARLLDARERCIRAEIDATEQKAVRIKAQLDAVQERLLHA